MAFEKTEIEQDLIWCLSEIKKDIVAQGPKDPGAPKERVEKKTLQGLEGEYIEAALRDIKQHEGCFTAVFCDSRRSFKVARKDKLSKEYVVRGLAKKRRKLEAFRGLEDNLPRKDYEDLECCFIEAASRAKDFFDGCPCVCLEPR